METSIPAGLRSQTPMNQTASTFSLPMRVPFFLRHGGEGYRTFLALPQLLQPDPGVDLVDDGIFRPWIHDYFPLVLLAAFSETGFFAARQRLLCIQQAEQLDGLGHQPGPAGLVAGTQSGAVVAVEIFVEKDQVSPVGIALEFLRAAVDRPLAVFVLQEDACETVCRSPAPLRKGSSWFPDPVGHSILKLSP